MTLSDGATLHFIDRGVGHPVVFLHGGMGDMDSWMPQISAFSSRYRAISYSRRDSYPNKNRLHVVGDPAARDADDLGELLGILRIDSAHLVGASYGALIALMFALRRPTLVSTLTLSEPPLHAWLEQLPDGVALRDRFMGEVWNRAAAEFRKRRSSQAMSILAEAFGLPASQTSGAQDRAALRNDRAMKALVLSEKPFPMVDRAAVRELKVPTLVVRGEATDPIHRMAADELATLPERVWTAVIPKAGHRAAADNPEAFTKAVLRFLADVSRELP